MMSEIKALRNSECWCGTKIERISHMQWEYYVVYCVAVQIEYMEAFEAIQELICLKGVLMIEIWLIQ